MKKIISLALCLLALVSCFAFVSCGNNGDNNGDNGGNNGGNKGSKNNIGVQAGTTGQYFVEGDADWEFEGIEGYTAKPYENGALAITDMKNGNVSYVIIDKAPAIQLSKKFDGVKVIEVELTQETYAFGVDKAQPALREAINNILATRQNEIKAIIDKYATGEGITPIESAVKDLNKKDQQLVIATNAAFPPFEYKDGTKYAGIDIEIMAMVANELGMELVVEDMEFDAVVGAVGNHGIDVAAAGLSVNETRAKAVDFTNSYYDAAQVIIVPADCKDFEDCKTAEDIVAKLAELKK